MNIRLILVLVPALGTIVGLLWLRKRRKKNQIEYHKPPDTQSKKSETSKDVADKDRIIPQKSNLDNQPESRVVDSQEKSQTFSTADGLLFSTRSNEKCKNFDPQAPEDKIVQTTAAKSNNSVKTDILSDLVTCGEAASLHDKPSGDCVINESLSSAVRDPFISKEKSGEDYSDQEVEKLEEMPVLKIICSETSAALPQDLGHSDVTFERENNHMISEHYEESSESHLTSRNQNVETPDKKTKVINKCQNIENKILSDLPLSSDLKQTFLKGEAEHDFSGVNSSVPSGTTAVVENICQLKAGHCEQQCSPTWFESTQLENNDNNESEKHNRDQESYDATDSLWDVKHIEASESVAAVKSDIEHKCLNNNDTISVSHSPPSSSSNESSVTSSNNSDQDMQSETSTDSQRESIADSCSPISSLSASIKYDFDFPTEYCGQLIGRMGRNINKIKDISGVQISVNPKKFTQDLQIITLEGAQVQIDKALCMLKGKFIPKNFPGVTFEPAQQESPVLYPEMMQLCLPEGGGIEVLVSSVVSPNHLFFQQPTHPSFHMLEKLNQFMNVCYAEDDVVPQLPRPIEVGVICAAPMYNTGWYRAQVVQSYPDTDEVDIKFVDYGGYLSIQGSLLRQIRSDFSMLPFQAVEVFMANVMPPIGSEGFGVESVAMMEQLVQGKLLQAEVIGHEESNGIPYVQLYEIQGDKIGLVNRELVNNGAAQWIEHLS